MLYSVTEIAEKTAIGDADDKDRFMLEWQSKRVQIQGMRAFYIAKAYAMAFKYPEALVLFERSAEHAERATDLLGRLGGNIEKLRSQDAKSLLARARGERCLIHARGLAAAAQDQAQVSKSMAQIDLDKAEGATDSTTEREVKRARYLSEELDSFPDSLAQWIN